MDQKWCVLEVRATGAEWGCGLDRYWRGEFKRSFHAMK